MGKINQLNELTTPTSAYELHARATAGGTDADKRLAISKLGVLNLAATWTALQTLAPTSTSDNGLVINLPSGSTANHIVAQAAGTSRNIRRTVHYSSAIAPAGNATVASISLPANTVIGGTITFSIRQDSTGGTRRGHYYVYGVGIEVFASSCSPNGTAVYTRNSTNESAPTIAFTNPSGTTMGITVTNNGGTKNIDTVTVTLDLTIAT